MWFAHATGPLGTYIRMKWMYIMDIEKCSEENFALSPQSSTLNLNKNLVDDAMVLSSLDPDMIDLLRTSEKDTVCVYLYGR